jgi:hypothetical protein
VAVAAVATVVAVAVAEASEVVAFAAAPADAVAQVAGLEGAAAVAAVAAQDAASAGGEATAWDAQSVSAAAYLGAVATTVSIPVGPLSRTLAREAAACLTPSAPYQLAESLFSPRKTNVRRQSGRSLLSSCSVGRRRSKVAIATSASMRASWAPTQ